MPGLLAVRQNQACSPASAPTTTDNARRGVHCRSEAATAKAVSTRAASATAAHDPHKIGWTRHQLRHSALQHLAVDGRTAPELQAKSRHAHLASLGRYVQLGEQTSAQVTANADPAARRKPR